ncbi:hypothetical protein [Hymenobacter ruricola]|uniref:DUF4178 domain-containing protein n=1 Tax=Hymenobacter ruricola TaxID=2791023 RepID=A0ABS0I7V5_9BACT|nr:hypothetical protein [Hymenobacter ruricola]MBF9222846.1 hypothetical protein [Hymenobacter ruricola]
MRILVLFPVALLVMLSGHRVQAQDDVPVQLGAPPAMPEPAWPRPTSALPVTTPVAPPDSTRRAVTATPIPAPVYAPTPAGQLPGTNTATPYLRVGLKNGMLYSATHVKKENSRFGHSYLLLDGGQKFELSEVGFYEDETGHYVRTILPNSSREAVLRREKTGRLSLYSMSHSRFGSGASSFDDVGYSFWTSETSYEGLSSYSYSGYSDVKTEYFSKNNGLVQKITTNNLIAATLDNAEAQKLLLQSRRNQRIVLGSYVVGGGLLVVGLFQSLRLGVAQTSPLVYAAIPILIIPVVLQSKNASNQRQVIALYNSMR